MEIWVRSQNKKILTQCIELQLQEKQKEQYSILGGKYGKHTLGIYKNKERALEVLDEIQHKICKGVENDCNAMLYEMPQE